MEMRLTQNLKMEQKLLMQCMLCKAEVPVDDKEAKKTRRTCSILGRKGVLAVVDQGHRCPQCGAELRYEHVGPKFLKAWIKSHCPEQPRIDLVHDLGEITAVLYYHYPDVLERLHGRALRGLVDIGSAESGRWSKDDRIAYLETLRLVGLDLGVLAVATMNTLTESYGHTKREALMHVTQGMESIKSGRHF